MKNHIEAPSNWDKTRYRKAGGWGWNPTCIEVSVTSFRYSVNFFQYQYNDDYRLPLMQPWMSKTKECLLCSQTSILTFPHQVSKV